MAKKVKSEAKSDSLVSTISVETPKVTELNITRADLISYVTAEAKKQYDLDVADLKVKLGMAVTKYFDRCVASAKDQLNLFNQTAEKNGLSKKDINITHSIIGHYIGYINISYDKKGSIISATNVDNIFSRNTSTMLLESSGEDLTKYNLQTVFKFSKILRGYIVFPHPNEVETTEIQSAVLELNMLLAKGNSITDKNTKNSIISNMLEGSDKGKQMKESLHAIAKSIRSELDESLKLVK
jgi:hypothetical protein